MCIAVYDAEEAVVIPDFRSYAEWVGRHHIHKPVLIRPPNLMITEKELDALQIDCYSFAGCCIFSSIASLISDIHCVQSASNMRFRSFIDISLS